MCAAERAASARRRRAAGPSAGAAVLLVLAGCGPVPRPAAEADELLLLNGRVWTMAAEASRSRADAVAVRGERIVAVGSAEQARAAVGPAARIVDLHGATVLPGFVDAHVHLLWIGEKLLRAPGGVPRFIDLSTSRSARQAAALVAAAAGSAPGGAWILGYGWDQEKWAGRGFPSAAELDAALPSIPAALTRSDFHAVWVSSEALRLAGIVRGTPDPDGGRIVRSGKAGQPTGVLLDRAFEPVARLVPRFSPEEKREAYRLAVSACLGAGITTVQIAGSPHASAAVWDPAEAEEDRRILRDLIEQEHLPLRVSWMELGPGAAADRRLARGAERGALGGSWDEAAIKVFMDGALGSRGAALLGEYADEPGTRGFLRTRREALASLSRRALARGIQICAHAIGPKAVREALDAFQEAAGGNLARLRQARFRVEHASVIHPDDLPRFAALGIIASVQPGFIAPDGEGRTMEDRRLGPAAPEKIYPFRSLLDSGASLCGSTDAGAPGLSILAGIEAAVTRGGWRAAERLRTSEALALFTRESARAAFMEERVGTLEAGKYADLVILASDPMEVQAGGLGGIEILATIAGGRIVHGEERLDRAAGARQ